METKPDCESETLRGVSSEYRNACVAQTKQLRVELDQVLQHLRRDSEARYGGYRPPNHRLRASRERSLAMTKLQEAIMWLGMDLKAIGEENPYPHSYDPTSPIVDPTSQGLKL